MNPQNVVRIENIYANEILHSIKLSPFKIKKNLTLNEIKLTITHSKKTLNNAINEGGLSVKDYINLNSVVVNF